MTLHRRPVEFERSARTCVAMLSCLLLFAASPFTFSSAWADTLKRPYWTEQAMFQFGDDVFFVGQSSCAKTSEDGRQRAFTHGVQEIMNYAPTLNASGLHIDTQMVFEEAGTPPCPDGTVTVWRLLRVESARLTRAGSGSHRRTTAEAGGLATDPADSTPSIGMSRDEVFDRFGLPASMTMRPHNQFTWEYRRFGFAVEFDRHMVVKRWTITGTPARYRTEQSAVERMARASIGAADAPAIDLTAQLRDLEEAGPPSSRSITTLYNGTPVGPGPTAVSMERSITSAETFASITSHSPRSNSLSEEITGLQTCRREQGRPGQSVSLQTKRGITVNPACISP